MRAQGQTIAARQAFSLVESVVSMSILTVVMAGLGSALLIAGHALPSATGDTLAVVQTAAVLDGLIEELAIATQIIEQDSSAITFQVPDRDNDNADETIRYAWSEQTGEDLIRQYNQGTPVVVAANLTAFTLTYAEGVESGATDEGAGLGADRQLLAWPPQGSIYQGNVNSNQRPGQYVHPAVPDDDGGYAISGVSLYFSSFGITEGSVTVELRTADQDGAPTDEVLDQTSVALGDIQYQMMVNVSFDAEPVLTSEQGACIVLRIDNPSHGVGIFYTTGNTMPDQSFLINSNDSGATWDTWTSYSLVYALYGRYVSQPAGGDEASQYITHVDVHLEAGSTHPYVLDAAATLLNRPAPVEEEGT